MSLINFLGEQKVLCGMCELKERIHNATTKVANTHLIFLKELIHNLQSQADKSLLGRIIIPKERIR